MTELEQIESMFRRAGVAFEKATTTVRQGAASTEIYFSGRGTGPSNEGEYGGAWLVFDDAGSLLRVGASES